jgi:TubC N-terminal docking domain
MNLQTLLEELNHLGVELQAVGDTLEYEAPEETITPVLLKQLKAHKADLLAVLRNAETVEGEDRRPAEAASTQTSSGLEARKLLATGWEPKERCGKIIWKCPDTGFYYSQEMARLYLRGGVGTIGYKSGATGKG